MAITSRSQIIDISTIQSGCAIISSAASDYTKSARYINEAADICSPEALAIEKQSMQPTLQDLGAAVATIEANINEILSQIKDAAMQIYSKQEQELIAYEQRIAAEKAAAEEAARQQQQQQAAAAANAQ